MSSASGKPALALALRGWLNAQFPFMPAQGLGSFHMVLQRVLDGLQGPEKKIPAGMEIAHLPYERGSPYPGIYLFTAAARFLRPVRQVASRAPELIGSLEQAHMSIR